MNLTISKTKGTKTNYQPKNKTFSFWAIFTLAIFGFILLCFNPVMAEDVSYNIMINPIGDHKTGEAFEISGNTTLKNPEFILLQINPKNEYESIKKWVAETKNPEFSFSIEVEGEEDLTPGNITRYYADGRSESRIYPMPINRAYLPVKITTGPDEVSNWSVICDGKNFLGDILKPGEYSVLVKGEDGTMQGVADTSFTIYSF